MRVLLTKLNAVNHGWGLEDEFWSRRIIYVKYVGVHGRLNALTVYLNLRDILFLESLTEHGNKLLRRSVDFWLEDETIQRTLDNFWVLEHRDDMQRGRLWNVLQSWVVEILSCWVLGIIDVKIFHRDSRLHLHGLDVASLAFCLLAKSQNLLLFFHGCLVQDFFLKHRNRLDIRLVLAHLRNVLCATIHYLRLLERAGVSLEVRVVVQQVLWLHVGDLVARNVQSERSLRARVNVLKFHCGERSGNYQTAAFDIERQGAQLRQRNSKPNLFICVALPAIFLRLIKCSAQKPSGLARFL